MVLFTDSSEILTDIALSFPEFLNAAFENYCQEKNSKFEQSLPKDLATRYHITFDIGTSRGG